MPIIPIVLLALGGTGLYFWNKSKKPAPPPLPMPPPAKPAAASTMAATAPVGVAGGMVTIPPPVLPKGLTPAQKATIAPDFIGTVDLAAGTTLQHGSVMTSTGDVGATDETVDAATYLGT